MRPLKPALAFMLSLVLLPAVWSGCGQAPPANGSDSFLVSLADRVDADNLVATVEYLASGEMRGRPTGSPQAREVAAFLEGELRELGLVPVDELGLDGYRQEFPVPPERCFITDPPPADTPVSAANILGKLPGESAQEMVVLTANYDGMGVDPSSGSVYPGADYNASGASAVLELASVFATLGRRPQKTIVFAFLDAEECGTYGSAALAQALESAGLRNSVRIINLEGLAAGEGGYMGVWDLNYRKNRPTVQALQEAADLLEVTLELGGADPGTSAITFFLYHMPAVTCDWSWFERSEHPDFHQPSDTPERINREGMLHTTRVVAAAVWLLAG